MKEETVQIPTYMHQWIMDLCAAYDKKFDELMPDIISAGISAYERNLLRMYEDQCDIDTDEQQTDEE